MSFLWHSKIRTRQWAIRSTFSSVVFLSLLFLYIYFSSPSSSPEERKPPFQSCDVFNGKWIFNPNSPPPLYNGTCPFHRNAWNCLRNQRKNMDSINSYRWVPKDCNLERIDPHRFLTLMRNRNIGFVGDSLNENFVVGFLCILRVADSGVKKWKRKGAWKGGYFPKFNVTVAYHRAVLLAKYQWQPKKTEQEEGNIKGTYRVDVDIPAKEWSEISSFYDVVIFNTGHWWNYDKFPMETPLVFYQGGKPLVPAPGLLNGFEIVLEHMISYIEKEFPRRTLKFWRLQSPRHFYGGDWNQNGSCLFNEPIQEHEVESWFGLNSDGVNREARVLNELIEKKLRGSGMVVLDLTHLSEFRADAHPAVWLGKQDAVSIWGQDCMHWCLPGVPDTWVDVLSEMILRLLPAKKIS